MAHVLAHSAWGTYLCSYTNHFSVYRLPSCCGAPAASKRHRSLALQQQAVGHHDLSRSRVCCSLRRDCITAAVASATPAAQSGAAAASSGVVSQSASYAAVQQLVEDRGLDSDPALVAQEAHLTFNYLQSQDHIPPAGHVHDVYSLVVHALQLSDLMATGSTFRTLQMIKRHPGLLSLTPQQVAGRVLSLKLMMPAADVSRLLYQKPTLLLIDDLPGVVGVALNKLHMLMPGIPVEAKLHEGGTVFWSFASLIQDASSNKAAQAHSARRQQPAAAAAVTAAAPPAAAAAAGTAGVFGICGGRFGISRRTIFAG